MTPESKLRGYKPGRFSFNVKGGRCETCKGDGQIKIEMHFLPDVYVPCEVCHGKRYNRDTLEVRYKGKNIAEVLEMSVEESVEFFANVPRIARRLRALDEVGLGYVKLGQPATTLSGGEAQRVKLATELSKVATGKTLYILDEPTTGLHFQDIDKLLEMLQRLVDQGNTVVVIEHNLDVIKSADWVVDLGPEGGDEGGRVVAAGTPEELAGLPELSHTGEFLARALAAEAARPAPARKASPAAEGGRVVTAGEGPVVVATAADGIVGSIMAAALESAGIPVEVRSANRGWLFPGVQTSAGPVEILVPAPSPRTPGRSWPPKTAPSPIRTPLPDARPEIDPKLWRRRSAPRRARSRLDEHLDAVDERSLVLSRSSGRRVSGLVTTSRGATV